MATRYVEVFALQNACINAGLLWIAAALGGGEIRARRIFFSAMLGGLYAAAAAMAGGALCWLPVKAIVSILMAMMALKSTKWRKVLRCAAALWMGASVLGGMLSMGFSALASGILTAVCGIALVRRKNAPAPRCVRLFIRQGLKSREIEAIVDTGNRALDPLTGLPVVFIEAGVFLTQPGRMLSIKTAAGGVVVPCFMPDEIRVSGREVRALVACCARGSLESALVPPTLCVERKAA